jgi:hypothetical protein
MDKMSKTELKFEALSSGEFFREMNITDISIGPGEFSGSLENKIRIENDEFYCVIKEFLIISDDMNDDIETEFKNFKLNFDYDDGGVKSMFDWEKLETQWKDLFKKALYEQMLKDVGTYFRLKLSSYNVPKETILKIYEESMTQTIVED